MIVLKDVGYKPQEQCKLDCYFPETKGFPVIVYFHGGGLETGDKAQTAIVEIAERFVQNGYGFVSVNYRMYTSGGKYPDYLCDGADSIAFVKNHLSQYGGNGEIFVAGKSAGAWISLMLCLNGKYLSDVGIEPLSIGCWIIDSAQATSHFNVLKYEKGEDPSAQRIDEYAPLYYVGQSTEFSKMLLFFYEDDMPCRPEQNRLFYKAIKTFHPEAEIDYMELPGGHCYGSSRKDEDGEYRFVKETLRWLKKKGL
ncbi:MAG: alpha/beta hydrolase [Clostridia bacterium]|nr:alpha/beta hydrolase [Clostridia bacterium]